MGITAIAAVLILNRRSRIEQKPSRSAELPLQPPATQDDLLTRRSQLEHEILLLLDGNTGMINYRKLIITDNKNNVPFYSALYRAKQDNLKQFYNEYRDLMQKAKNMQQGRGPGVQPMSEEICSLCEELIGWQPPA